MLSFLDFPCDVALAIAAGLSPTKAFRLAAGMTINHLADRSGIQLTRVEEIEAGSGPEITEILALGKALNVRADLLFHEA